MRLGLFILLIFFVVEQANAEITKLLKKRRIVVIDDGNVSKGDKVCFFSKKRKRACGRVVRVRAKKSYVRVKSKKRFRRLKKGMSHEVTTSSGRMAGGKKTGFSLRLSYTPGVLPKTNINYLKFTKEENAKAIDDDPFVKMDDSDVTKDDTMMSKLARMFPWLSMGLEAEIGITRSMSIAMGGRFIYLNPALSPNVASTYKVAKADAEYLRMKYTGYEMTFWLDYFFFYIPDIKTKIAIGGEFTMSNVEVETVISQDELDSESKPTSTDDLREVFKGSSAAQLVSGRLTARRDFPMRSYGYSMALSAVVSPLVLSSSFSLSGDPADEILAEYADKDELTKNIKDATDHGATILTAVVSFSFYFGN